MGRTRKFAFGGIIVAAIVAGGASALADSATPSLRQIVSYFNTIVFASELSPEMASKVVAKWQDNPVGISLSGRIKPFYIKAVERHLREITRVSGVRFKQVKPNTPNAISLYFLTRAEIMNVKGPNVDSRFIQTQMLRARCLFLAYRKPEDRIVRALIFVNVEAPDPLIDSCLLEELVQSMGLPNDSNNLRPSIFSDLDHLTRLSYSDKVLLRVLYDPRLKPGTPQREALGIVAKVAAQVMGVKY